MLLIYILICLFILLLGYQVFLAFSSNKIIEGLENGDTTTDTTTTTPTTTDTTTSITTVTPTVTTPTTTSTSSQSYQPYNVSDPNNSLILSQQNAGNIDVLKGRVDNLDGVKQKVDDMKISIDSMQTQIDGLVNQQANYAQEIAGSTPVDITGTNYDTTENVENSIEEDN